MPALRYAFVLRLNFETDANDPDAPPLFRGSLQDVSHEQIHHFTTMDGMLNILRVETASGLHAAAQLSAERSERRRVAKSGSSTA